MSLGFRRLSWPERALLLVPLSTAGMLWAFAQSDLYPLFGYPALATWILAVGSLALPNNPLGARVPLALGLVTLLCCGTSPYLHNFGLGCALYVGSAMIALQATSAAGWKRIHAREWLGSGAVAVCAFTIGGLLYVKGDGLFWWAHSQLRRWSIDRRVGFDSEPISLRSLRGVYLSEVMVMRVHGQTPSHLRGAVYDRYLAGRWTTRTPNVNRSTLLRRIPVTDSPTVRVDYVGSQTRHLFLPNPVGAITSEDRGVLFDDFGVLRLIPPAYTDEYEFALEGTDLFGPPPPGEDRENDNDYSVADSLTRDLDRWLDRYVDRSQPPRAIAERIERVLSEEYTYSLNFERESGRPLLDFLWNDRRGHCEYFATAMTLLARRAGIAARLVAGYYVSERSAITDYAVVRERDAHAWSEVYLPDEGWVQFDPSPRAELERNRGLAGWRAWWDAALVYWQWILASLLPIGVGSLAFSVWWRKRHPKRSRSQVDVLAYESPPAAFRALESALVDEGFTRPSATPLTSWSRDLEEANRPGASRLVGEYAAQRYSTGTVSSRWQRDAEHWIEESKRTTARLADPHATGNSTDSQPGSA